jgi:hypothetical protein
MKIGPDYWQVGRTFLPYKVYTLMSWTILIA